ncbi:MAG: winged helix-turn-helix domain-containing protein [Anaerolineae bacterium]|nr:winged helix-turn-helix domain-containing protein [Anaerolineae bacterium]
MKNQLNEYDRSPLPSTPDSPRWRNTAQWARNGMVKEGLMASDSPRRIWEITDEGEQWLEAQMK